MTAAQRPIKKMDKLNITKIIIGIIFASEDTIKRVERQFTEWEDVI